jgi:hypothetical protein
MMGSETPYHYVKARSRHETPNLVRLFSSFPLDKTCPRNTADKMRCWGLFAPSGRSE